MRITLLTVVLFLSACASNEEFANHRAEFKERFLAEKRACMAQGGTIVMDGHVYREVPPVGTAYRCSR